MNRRFWAAITSRPRMHAAWATFLVLVSVKILARWVWGYRPPWPVDVSMFVAMIVLLIVDARGRRSAETEQPPRWLSGGRKKPKNFHSD